MCGIGGILSLSQAPPSREDAERLSLAIARRGPDGEGWFEDLDGGIRLVHRRLAIIDPGASSSQPMSADEGRYTIVFNGEIYNHVALRERLEAEGVCFASAGDTEVLLWAYIRWGEACVEALEGMFAFAVWDRVARSLFLARDPYGIKPLYLHEDSQALSFSSSVGALRSLPRVQHGIDDRALMAYLAWGYLPEPMTLTASIRALPAGSTLWVREGRVGTPRCYWSPARAYGRAEAALLSDAELTVRAREALQGTVRRHLVADVDVGLFLSAGVDSSALLALATEESARALKTTTLAFGRFQGTAQDESPLAIQTAKHLHADHQTVYLEDAEVEGLIPAFLAAMDQPTNDGLNTYLVARAARSRGLVCVLSGLGGDELFGGYPSMRRFVQLVRARQLGPTRWLRALSLEGLPLYGRRASKLRFLPQALASDAHAYYLLRGVRMPDEIAHLMGPERFARAGGLEAILEPVRDAWRDGPTDPWARSLVAEQSMYMRNQLLRDSDWATMAHGLELRVPLVDRTLTERLGVPVSRLRGRGAKRWLANASQSALLPEIERRPKTGFAVPMADWTCRALERGVVRMPDRELLPGAGTATSLIGAVRRGDLHWSRAWTLLVLEGHQ